MEEFEEGGGSAALDAAPPSPEEKVLGGVAAP